MRLRSPSIERFRSALVLDASVAINLLGTNMGDRVLQAIPQEVHIAQHALREIRRHPVSGLHATGDLCEWQDRRLISTVALDQSQQRLFNDLTSKNLEHSLDDGEAATIAYAMGGTDPMIPVIDEKKATRIFRARWPSDALFDTVGLFWNLVECDLMPVAEARHAVFSALRHARMQVRHGMREWVVQLIGEDLALQCPSLGMRSLRQ